MHMSRPKWNATLLAQQVPDVHSDRLRVEIVTEQKVTKR
jgi:hypothetical protein